MKLNSLYLFGIAELIGRIFTLGQRMPVGPCDHTAVLLVALYMMNDSEAHQAMQLELKQKYPHVLDNWNKYFDITVLKNNEISENETVDINALLKRIANENQR